MKKRMKKAKCGLNAMQKASHLTVAFSLHRPEPRHILP